jgi:ABC-type sugar transport system substrate-binding protein
MISICRGHTTDRDTVILRLILGFLAVSIGCHRAGDGQTEKSRFAFVVNVPTDRYWDIASAGCLQAAAEEDVIVEFHAPNESTARQQKQIVETLMSRRLDGMATLRSILRASVWCLIRQRRCFP